MTNLYSALDQHPEDLLDRMRRSETDPSERRHLKEHLAFCEICALQVQNASIADAPEVVPASDAHLDRIAMRGVMVRLPSARGRHRPYSSRLRWRLAVGAVMLSGTAAAASWWVVRREPPPVPAAIVATAIQDRNEPAQAPPADDTLLPVEDVSRQEKPASASALFDRARKLRLEGDVSGARAIYRRLQNSYPDSRETALSYLILGRILLERDRPQLAAAQFGAYLARGGGGSEEALVGRAMALQKMGRAKDEADDWKSLLARHPRSLYAPRAHTRLEELQRAHSPAAAGSSAD